MVIQHFNKLIRNKWFWGVFAFLISFFFAFDFLLSYLRDDSSGSRNPADGNSIGLLGGEPVDAGYFQAIAEDVRGIGQNRDWRRKTHEVNREAWETIAAIDVAKRNGIEATDAEVQETIRNDRSFQSNGTFSYALYQQLLQANSVLPSRFERFLKRRLTVQRVADAMTEAAAWVSPAEIDRGTTDMTDVLTVKVASFRQDAAEAEKVTLDDAGLRKWYGENTNSLALPERVKIRFVRFDANDPKLLERMTVSDDELHDYFDANGERYTKVDTNGVSVAKTFDEAKAEIEQELRRIAAVQCLETNLMSRVYARNVKLAADESRLDLIAREDSRTIETSDWFATDGSSVPGFMVPASIVCPGADGFADAVSQLDPESEDLRYGVVISDQAAWLIERAETSPAHVPTFDEAKEIVRPRALHAAKEEAFKQSVEALVAKGTNELFKAAASVSTNYVFSIEKISDVSFPDQYSVAMAARKLTKGGISEFVRTGADSAVVVVCEDRMPGNVADLEAMKSQVRERLGMMLRSQLPTAWQKWNLARVGFEAEEGASVEEVEDEE